MKAVTLLLPVTLAAIACSPAPESADIVIIGTVWTGDTARPMATGVAVLGERILAVADSSEVSELIGDETRVIRTAGLVVPGFSDDHVHFLDGGFQLTSVDLRDADTPAEFTRRIGEFATTIPAGEWIQGGTWDHELWPGAPLPTRQWIDSVTPDHPVFVQRLDGHMGVANSRALELAGIDRSTADIAGGTIIRDADGEPTGLLKDEAMGPVFAVIPAPSDRQADSAVVRAMRFANSKGVVAITSVNSSRQEIEATRRLRDAGQQTLRVSFHPSLSRWREVAEALGQDGPGDQWIRLAGVKGMVDGSLGSTTALFHDAYLDEPSSHGLFVTPEDSLRSWIGSADSAGLQVVVHAIGDRANGLLLDIFDSVATEHGERDRRFRIEHAQHLAPADIERMAALDVIASMQPYHAADDGRWAAKRIREPQLRGTYAFRSILDAGATLIFGSDWVVAPIDPLPGIWAAVTRQTIDGANPEGWFPEQQITVEEALMAYTAANAYGNFAESERGRIKVGQLADLAVLDANLLSIDPDRIRDARVVATVVSGKLVHELQD